MTNATPQLEKPEAVFFDWDGTLVDTYEFLNQGHCQTLTQLGMEPFKGDEFKAHFGRPREILYTEIYGADQVDRAKELFGDYVSENAHLLSPFEGAEKLLNTLKDLNIQAGVVSNKHKDFIAREMNNFGWQKYFDALVGAGEASEDKPSGAPLRLALDRAKFKGNPSKIWYVGDTESDLKCAADLQCQAVFIKGHHETERLIKEYKPLLSVTNLSELQSFLVAI
ncbi:MAG: HAD-IA family hydrolase [Alphaproteobacteria bacterium]|nr:HAD-IA family hydrolase [Alphaproteobacteria bacterium]